MIDFKMEETRRAIRDEANWLFSRQNIEGLFPVFYLFYSYKQELPTWLDDPSLTDEGPDALQNSLFKASLSVFGGKADSFGKLQGMYARMKKMGRKVFLQEYVRLVEEMICHTSLVGGTAELPNQRIATTICNIFREKGCKSVYTAYSGAGSYVAECQGMSYYGAEPSETFNLIAAVIADAYQIESCSFDNEDPLMSWPRKKYDAIIGNLPVDVDFFDQQRADHLLSGFNEKIDTFVKKLIKSRKATVAAVFLSHFEFANKRDYDETRKKLCDSGMLDTVIALPEDIFSQATVPTYIIVLDMKGGRNEATFIDATKSRKSGSHTISSNRIDLRDGKPRMVTVSYSVIAQANWAFNPFVYLQDAECPEGMELVRLGDLADFVGNMERSGLYLDPDHLSASTKTILEGMRAAEGKSAWSGACQLVPGHSVLLRLSRGARRQEQNLVCGLYKDSEPCRTDFFVSVLKPHTDKILPEYLALALITDPSFKTYYKNIQQYYTDDIRASHLRERRIPVLTDLIEQRKAVTAASGLAASEDTIYNIVLVGAGDKERSYTRLLDSVKCIVIKTTETVEGDDGLETILEQATKEGVALSKKVDAVVFQTDVNLSAGKEERPFSGMDAIADLRLLYEPKGILFYAASDASVEDIVKEGILSERRLKPFLDGHFFMNKKGLPDKALSLALRKELEEKGSDEARIRTLQRQAFEAADWIDANFEGNEVSEVLSDFLIAKEFGKDSLRKLSTLRTVAHNLIDILKKWNIVPDASDLDHGAIPHLIYDQKFETKLTTYIYWDDTVMDKSLSAALIALIEIGNEGTHTFNTNPLLGATMLNTLMAFILWLYKGRDSLPQRKTPWYKESLNERIRIDDLPMTGTVKQVTVKGKRIWVCGNVHLQEPADGDIREGDVVTINRVKPETKFKTPEINALAFNDCYSIDKSARD